MEMIYLDFILNVIIFTSTKLLKKTINGKMFWLKCCRGNLLWMHPLAIPAPVQVFKNLTDDNLIILNQKQQDYRKSLEIILAILKRKH